jgi:uncharacterized protein
MEIKYKDDGAKWVFYVKIEGEKQAEMTYVWAGTDKIITDHTEMNESLIGKGIGKQLVSASVDFVRNKKISFKG